VDCLSGDFRIPAWLGEMLAPIAESAHNCENSIPSRNRAKQLVSPAHLSRCGHQGFWRNRWNPSWFAGRCTETVQPRLRPTAGLKEPPPHHPSRRGPSPGHRRGIQPRHPPQGPHQTPQNRLTDDNEDQHTEHMRYENRAERAKLRAVKALISLAILGASPVLLIAGAPIRRRYLRYIYRDEAPHILDKQRGQVSAHYFVVAHPLLAWLCWPTESRNPPSPV
jgi:hypothetical protein